MRLQKYLIDNDQLLKCANCGAAFKKLADKGGEGYVHWMDAGNEKCPACSGLGKQKEKKRAARSFFAPVAGQDVLGGVISSF